MNNVESVNLVARKRTDRKIIPVTLMKVLNFKTGKPKENSPTQKIENKPNLIHIAIL